MLMEPFYCSLGKHEGATYNLGAQVQYAAVCNGVAPSGWLSVTGHWKSARKGTVLARRQRKQKAKAPSHRVSRDGAGHRLRLGRDGLAHGLSLLAWVRKPVERGRGIGGESMPGGTSDGRTEGDEATRGIHD